MARISITVGDGIKTIYYKKNGTGDETTVSGGGPATVDADYVYITKVDYKSKDYNSWQIIINGTIRAEGYIRTEVGRRISENLKVQGTLYHKASASAKSGGTATVSYDSQEGELVYVPHGADATWSAVANNGYEFIQWTDGRAIVSKRNPYPTAVNSDRTLTADFELSSAKITFKSDGVYADITYIDTNGKTCTPSLSPGSSTTFYVRKNTIISFLITSVAIGGRSAPVKFTYNNENGANVDDPTQYQIRDSRNISDTSRDRSFSLTASYLHKYIISCKDTKNTPLGSSDFSADVSYSQYATISYNTVRAQAEGIIPNSNWYVFSYFSSSNAAINTTTITIDHGDTITAYFERKTVIITASTPDVNVIRSFSINGRSNFIDGSYQKQISITVPMGSNVSLNAYETYIDEHYVWNGWWLGDTQVTEDYSYEVKCVESALTYSCKALPRPYVVDAKAVPTFENCFKENTIVPNQNNKTRYLDNVTFTAQLKDGFVFKGWYEIKGGRYELVSSSFPYPWTVTGERHLFAAADFVWDADNNKVRQGENFNITKNEWDRLQDFIVARINNSKNEDIKNIKRAEKNGSFTHNIFNSTVKPILYYFLQIRNSYYKGSYKDKKRGDIILADDINGVRDAANSIPLPTPK